MRQSSEFRILGPLDVVVGGRKAHVGGGKQRALLALLLLRQGEVVHTDALIETLWRESRPASAANSVHIYVSQLRKQLGEERLVTRGGGYALVLDEGDELDAGSFERLLAQGRELRAAGDAAAAVEALTRALALWRGSALEEFRYEEFAQREIGRLEELRLLALEERIEAELAIGRADALVPELEALVQANLLRERLRGQLMLALYRAGRQSEALDVYREGRRILSEELGLQPGPALQELERAILNQDPALEAKAAPVRARATRSSALVLAASGMALLAVIGAVVVVATGGGSKAGLASVSPDAVGVIDPKTNRIVAEVPVAGGPTRLEVGAGQSVWVGNDESRTVSSLELDTYKLSSVVATPGFPSDIAFGAGALWVVDGKSGLLAKIDPTYRTVVARARVAARNPVYDVSRYAFDPFSVAVGDGSVWLTDGSHWITRADLHTGKIVKTFDLHRALDGVAVGAGAVWVISGESATVMRLNRGGDVTLQMPIVSKPGFESPYPLQITVGAGYVWVLNGNTATVTKIDPGQRVVSATIPIGIDRAPSRLAAGAGSAWVADGDGTLARIDASTNDVTIIPVGHNLRDVAVSAGTVWVTAGSGLGGTASRSTPVSGEQIRPLPTSSCSPIYYEGRGRLQYLIASDLPLQGFGTTTPQQAEAIQFVLRQHRFRAGRYAIGYQSCDDSTIAEGSFSTERCAENAGAYASNPSVIGVIGPFSSGCAFDEVPILNTGVGGPVPTISYSNTYVGLTRAGKKTESGEPGQYYPTGVRNYIRIIAADDLQAAADAILARRLGARTVFVVNDPYTGYGEVLAASFVSAAAKLGLAIVGREDVPYGLSSSAPLTSQIKRAHADAVFLAASVGAGTADLITRLRAALPGIQVVTTDGFSLFEQLLKTVGPSAEGMTVSVPGVPNTELGGAGRSFVKAFGHQVGQTPDPWSVRAAQAAEVLLDAIARSDGTRASVVRELFKTRVTNGILGSFSFDRNGDTTAGAVTIYRIVHGAPKVFRVIKPSPSLVR